MIYIIGKPTQANITKNPIQYWLSPIFRQDNLTLRFPMVIFSPYLPKVFINVNYQKIEEPVEIILKNFTGFGTPFFGVIFKNSHNDFNARWWGIGEIEIISYN